MDIMVDINLVTTNFPEYLPSVTMPMLSSILLGGFQCQSCKLIFKTEQDLNFHNSVPEKLINCTRCTLKFQTFKGMKQHFGKKHEKSRPYRCSICHKKFRNVYASRIHKKQVHFHMARKICTFCGKNVYNKYSLSRHLKICTKNIEDLGFNFSAN